MKPGWKRPLEWQPGGPSLLTSIHSPQLGRECKIRIHLPASIDDGERLPVIYAQDGQDLFGPWFRKRTWRVGKRLDRMAALGWKGILVGIDNGGVHRAEEYSPFVDDRFGGGRADDYVSFLTDTLKPAIDAELPTQTSAAHTSILGSSLGALAALYAKFTRPDVFGSVAALSPSVSFAGGALYSFIEAQEPQGQVYIDAGTNEFIPASGEYLRRIRKLIDGLVSIGYEPGKDLDYVAVVGGTHDAASWGRRLPHALHFILSGAEEETAIEPVMAPSFVGI